MIGKTLAHYQITSQLGKGGMGEVYQAKDSKLDRDVAIKVLPEEFARDADRLARFQREAKLLASLNHPNIAAIYGLEESDGTHFLVMELIEGQTLAERIKSGPVPVEESLKLALQIAEALEAAHEKGVVHRDLKPANIKVTPEGKVKVLDFGLAKAYAGDSDNMNLSNSPTLSDMATQQGVILGTAAYMPPEQAKGKNVDKRADIWAFGVVLFEMLSGRQQFTGESVSETLAAVIKSEPEWNSLPPNLHPRIRLMLERCLEKDPKKRYSGINDAWVDIEKVLADPGGVFAQSIQAVKPRKTLRVGIPWVAAAVVIALVAGWLLKPSPPPESKQVMRLEYELPEGQQFNRDQTGEVAYDMSVSPDGSQFVYSTTDGLYLRSMNELTAKHIAGTDKDSHTPFFSPDGKWIGYWSSSDQKMKKVGVSGGSPLGLCDTGPFVLGAHWGLDDTIVYSDALNNGIMRVSSNGGTPETLVKASLIDIANNGIPVVPQMLPYGDTLLFTNLYGTDNPNNETVVQSLQTGDRKILFKGGIGAVYLPTGHIVYGLTNNDIGSLFAVPFDLKNLEITGGHVSLLDGVSGGNFSESGTFVYVPQASDPADTQGVTSSGRTLVWVDMQGNEEPIAAEPNNYGGLKISPDGNEAVLSINEGGNTDIWVLNLDRLTMPKLTFDDAIDTWPLWTPDGKQIVFLSTREGQIGIYSKSADGSGNDEKLASWPLPYLPAPFAWSKDGKTLLSWDLDISTAQTIISTMSMEGDPERKPILEGEGSFDHPQISPGGRWLAYASSTSGQNEVYVRSYPDVDSGGQWMVSTGGGYGPLWSPDGRELFYRNGDSVMACSVETDPVFNPGKCKELFQGTYSFNRAGNQGLIPQWDIHPNGDKFLMIKPPDAAAAESATEEKPAAVKQPKIIVVTNWFEELKSRAPVK